MIHYLISAIIGLCFGVLAGPDAFPFAVALLVVVMLMVHAGEWRRPRSTTIEPKALPAATVRALRKQRRRLRLQLPGERLLIRYGRTP